MKPIAAAFFCFLFVTVFAADFPAQTRKKITASASATGKVKETKKPETKLPPVSPPQIVFSNQQLDTEIFNEINLFRADPTRYVLFLEELKDKFDGNFFEITPTSKIATNEGVAAVNEAIAELSKSKPLKPFTLSAELSKAADDHLKDMSAKSFFSHRGSDGNTPDFRIQKYLNISQSEIRENLSMESKTAREIVLAWLIDDGSIKRGNRLSLLSQTLKFIGISSGKNKNNSTLAVATFSSDNRK